MNNGLDVIDRGDIFNMITTPSGAIYLHILTGDYVYRASGVGGTWAKIATTADFLNQGIIAIGANPLTSDTIAIAGSGAGSWPDFIAGQFKIATAGILGGVGGTLQSKYDFKGMIVFSAGQWIVVGSHNGVFSTPWAWSFSAAGAGVYNGSIGTVVGQDASHRNAQAIGSGDQVFQWDLSGAGGFNFLTAGGTVATRSTVFNLSQYTRQGAAFSPTGIYAMGSSSHVDVPPYMTSDSGATWSSMGATIPIGLTTWENCRDDNRWIMAGGGAIRLSVDRGLTAPINKEGNLPFLAPLISIHGIGYLS